MVTWKQRLKKALSPLRGLNDSTATLKVVTRNRDLLDGTVESTETSVSIQCKIKPATHSYLSPNDNTEVVAVVAALNLPQPLTPGQDTVYLDEVPYEIMRSESKGWLKNEPSAYHIHLARQAL